MRPFLLCSAFFLSVSPLWAAPCQDGPALLSKGDVARIVDEYLAARSQAESNPWDALNMYGDLRLRQEGSFAAAGNPDRYRSRARLRLGGTWASNDTLEVGARMVTGSRNDPHSPHVTFGDGFQGLELSLDRAYATWRPSLGRDSWLTGGKFSHPLRRNPVYGELVWDGDIQPEGLALGTSIPLPGALDDLRLSAGQFLLLEQRLAKDAWCTFAQAATGASLGNGRAVHVSASTTFLHDPTPDGANELVDQNRGNTLVGGEFAEDFGVFDLVADLAFDGGARPWVISAEGIRNLRADQSRDGWALGASLGRAAKRGDWRFYYQLQSIERDAVFSIFAQDDFTRATGFRSHVLGVNYQLTDGVGLHIWALVSDPHAPTNEDEWRVRIDLNIKF